ncbi:MAG: 5'-methylthioadenosine nucleosidase [Acidimicrobiales bacterium]
MQTLVVIAMQAEADPVIEALGLHGAGAQLHPAFPARLWVDERVAVATNGTDPRFGVDSIATQPAVTTTLHAVERLRPALVVSAGTAGGFAARGGGIGSVYLADRCVFHDRRVAVAGFDRYGDGDYPVADLGRIADGLGFERGTVSTGNALDAPLPDIEKMRASGAVAKDMEAAAVAWTCERLGVPFTALKVVTDLVDSAEETAEQFQRNLQTATATLAGAVASLVAALE